MSGLEQNLVGSPIGECRCGVRGNGCRWGAGRGRIPGRPG